MHRSHLHIVAFFLVILSVFQNVSSQLSYDFVDYEDLESSEVVRHALTWMESDRPDTKLVLDDGGQPIVSTNLGLVMGTRDEDNGYPFLAYRGIPYAQPPYDELRFMAPVPATPWGDVPFNASNFGYHCNQEVVVGDEDCLVLDVYTPVGAELSNASYPVIVFIHGGAFMVGSSSGYSGVYPMLKQDVILVLPQYRLGVLGFFSTGDSVAPGNQGLMDQTLALKFVKDNIAAFGGDPERITVMGHSAGSASAHFQMLTPASAGLFRGVILDSGTVLCPWATGRNFTEIAQMLASEFRCRANSSEEIVTCLQGVNAQLLSDKLRGTMEWNAQPFYFGPRVDGVYIPDEPATLMMTGQFNHVPVMVGTLRNELALETAEMYFRPEIIDSLTSDFETNGPISLMLFPDEDPVETTITTYEYYGVYPNITEEVADNLTTMYTERMFHLPVDWTVDLLADQVPVFVNELHHRGVNGYTNIYLNNGLNLTQAEQWISHGDELQYLFEWSHFFTLEEPDDIEVGRIYSTLWTNFAKYLDPTPDDSSLGFRWTTATSGEDRQFLRITPTPYMDTFYRHDANAFWNALPLRINDILQH